jgi:uncharacterized damage-inducible protein DinB
MPLYAVLMTIAQSLTSDYQEEMTNTRKLLERIPLDEAHRNYKPHAKSMQLDQLATHVAELPRAIKLALEHEVLEIDPATYQQPLARSTAELLAMFDSAAKEGGAAIESATDAAMQKNWTFRYGDQFSMTEPRTKVIRGLINHLIHHRAQLTVYLRLNGVPIPGMYGPSADE